MPNHRYLQSHRPCGWSRHTRMGPSCQMHMVVRCKGGIPALTVHAGTAEPFRVSPPEAVAYPLELTQATHITQQLRALNAEKHQLLAPQTQP
jgi:hypothetical protein